MARTRHQIAAWDFQGRPLNFQASLAGQVHGCIGGLPLAPQRRRPAATTDDGYTIVDITTRRAATAPHRVLVHLARAPGDGRLRVIGVRRL